MEFAIVSALFAALLALVVWLARREGKATEREAAHAEEAKQMETANEVVARVIREPHPIDKLRGRWTR